MTLSSAEHNQSFMASRKSTDKENNTALDMGMNFESIVVRMEEIASKLEGDDLELESALKLFEEGIKLSRLGANKLDDADKRMEILLKDEPETFDLDPNTVDSFS